MKLLLLIPELGYGGAEGALLRLARALSGRHDVDIVVFQEHYARGNYYKADLPSDLIVHRLDPDVRKRFPLRWVHRAKALLDLRKHLAADATISFLTGPNILNVLTGGPGLKIVSARATRAYEAGSSRFHTFIHRQFLDPLVFRLADAVVTVSDGLSLELKAGRSAQIADKIMTIAGYVDPKQILAASSSEIEPELSKFASFPIIISIGRQSKAKGFTHLLRVFAKLKTRRADAKLVLVGDGPQRYELEAHCAQLRLRHSKDVAQVEHVDVLFLGYRKDPHRYLQLARVFAFPSLSEGLPNILVEALSSPARIVAADIPWGTREILGLPAHPSPYPLTAPLETQYGILMPPIHVEAFDEQWVAALCSELDRDPLEAEDLARRRDRVWAFDVRLAAGRWSDILESLVKEKQ